LKEFHQTDLKHFRWTLEINVFGQINLVKTLLDLIPEGGKVIGISSLGGVRAIPYYTLVGASKGALESALRHIAVELSPKKINVNIVSAGVVETGALRFFPNKDQLIQESKRRTPLGRLVTPDDVANVVLLLASPLSDMIQGQTIFVDGGYSILAIVFLFLFFHFVSSHCLFLFFLLSFLFFCVFVFFPFYLQIQSNGLSVFQEGCKNICYFSSCCGNFVYTIS